MSKKLSFVVLFIICLVFQSYPGCDKDPLDKETIAAAENGSLNTGGNVGFKPGSMNLKCSQAGNSPANDVHCFRVGIEVAPHYYGSSIAAFGGSYELVNSSWRNSIGCQMYLYSGGNGKFRANANSALENIKWGVLINPDGNSAGGSSNLYVVMVEEDYGDLIDAQFGLGVFYPSSGTWSNSWIKN